MAMYGLKSNRAESHEIQKLVEALTRHVNNMADVFTPQAISMTMLGLQKMNADTSPSVCQMIAAINKKIRSLDSQACGNTLYGLQSMSSKENEVRSLMATLAKAIDACTTEMSPQELSNAYFGLQNMNSVYPEVVAVVTALNNKLHAIPFLPFTSQGVCNALLGFQTMSTSDSQEIERSMSLLTEKVLNCPEVMSPHEMGNAIFGTRF